MKKPFWKLQGAGNDYIYFDCSSWFPARPEELARRLSDRHFSVGGDGIVLIGRSETADARMRMFNADGSEGKMCGNAVRCVCKYLRDVAGLKKSRYTVETLSGVKTVTAEEDGAFTVDMGAPVSDPCRIPARFQEERLFYPLSVEGKRYSVCCLSMGNPHCVVFCEDVKSVPLARLGPLFEHHSVFPEGVNTEFVTVKGEHSLEVRVWERGSGETLACGTGACAAAVSAARANYCCGRIAVHLPGGTLEVDVSKENVLLSGAAELSFIGEIDLIE